MPQTKHWRSRQMPYDVGMRLTPQLIPSRLHPAPGSRMFRGTMIESSETGGVRSHPAALRMPFFQAMAKPLAEE